MFCGTISVYKALSKISEAFVLHSYFETHMVNQQLVIYIEQAKAKGLSDKEILAALKVDPAWVAIQEADAIDAFAFVNGNNRPMAPTAGSAAPVISSANFFLPKKTLVACAVVVVLVLIGGGVVLAQKKGFVARLLQANPEAAWNIFVQNQKIEPYTQVVTIEYTDAGQTREVTSVKLVDSGFTNGQQDLADIQLQHAVSYTVAVGGQQSGGNVEFRILNKALYVNLKDTPMGTFLQESEQNKTKSTWLKISLDPKDLGDMTAQVLPEATGEGAGPDATVLQQKIQDVKLKQVFEKPEVLGTEQVRGQNTVHLKLGFNKTALQDALTQVLPVLTEKDSAERREVMQKLITAWLDKFEVKDFQAWVGEKDGRLYKIVFKSNAPSSASVMQSVSGVAFENARQASSDAKRIADVRQMASALELYFNDHGVYPKAGVNGMPANLAPTYIGAMPEAPETSGLCTDYYNAYWYTPRGPILSGANGEQGYNDYNYTFCLGDTVGGYTAGLNKLTPQGISAAECVNTEAHPCSSGVSKNNPEDIVQELVRQLDFSASFSFTGEYYDYGKTQSVEAPTDSVDVMEQLQEARSLSRDAKRLADVRQLASAAELYFNDNEHYPTDLEELMPTYIGALPVVPAPQDGTCTAEQNKYSYKGSDKTYALSFCLGNTTGGYSPGLHILSEQGIR